MLQEPDNPWAQLAERDLDGERRNLEIDAELIKDRQEALSRCPILVLAPTAKDAGRQSFVEELRLRATSDSSNSSVATASDASTNNSDVLCAQYNGITFSVQSFTTSARSKRDKLKLSAADAAVVVFVVDLIAESQSDEDTVVQLRDGLHHLLFVCRAIGASTDLFIQLVFRSVDQFKTLVSTPDFAIHMQEKGVLADFPMFQVGAPASDNFKAVVDEFTQAASFCKPKHVSALLESSKSGQVAEDVLEQLSALQKARIQEVVNKDMQSTSHVETTIAQMMKEQRQQRASQPTASPPQSTSDQSAVSSNESSTKAAADSGGKFASLGLPFAIVAVLLAVVAAFVVSARRGIE